MSKIYTDAEEALAAFDAEHGEENNNSENEQTERTMGDLLNEVIGMELKVSIELYNGEPATKTELPPIQPITDMLVLSAIKSMANRSGETTQEAFARLMKLDSMGLMDVPKNM